MGQSYITEASDIGTLLDQAWNQAETAKGELGKWETSEANQALGLAESGYGTAGGIISTAVQMKNAEKEATQKAISQDIGLLASLAAGL
jgi:hypothetical protein